MEAGLEKTRKATFGRITTLFGASEITNDTWEELEAMLIQADLGVATSQSVIANLKQQAVEEGVVKTGELADLLENELLSRLSKPTSLNFDQTHPAVILLVGVNGSGKTTTAAKLGKSLSTKEKRCFWQQQTPTVPQPLINSRYGLPGWTCLW